MKRLIKTVVTAFTKLIKTDKNVVDASDLCKNNFKPLLYIQPDGRLYFEASWVYGEMVGMCEWHPQTKEFLGVDKSKIVIDCIVLEINRPE